ncbi:hypothetical protein N7499_007838 [Penicillium canescens]|uniref:Uncharacterized protein n=1 Tax=Penicillium canescens TaxID=5083 RepID=A0AAD6N277_PENCN|nr:uncharacterized protein N7446_012874 [Penicillium canescens]KAJ5985872.1 hypothetical protein N7522_013068 [Penicillium canescens]KAJ6022524.1 hypothetical protein N7460_012919 [Penicillium canescens]KAJ6026216.1 hypothetical protein N7444_013895 [Penicillium canescens]KAJ6041808.1 hypothetical protein N7446_012874 [Penicillium canescens]KAJ6075857.1 hypothetical protein N7499_007838 [Penicillium canescens]
MNAFEKMRELVEGRHPLRDLSRGGLVPSGTSVNPQHNTLPACSPTSESDQSSETAIDSDTEISPSATIEGATSSSPSKAPFARGHRRRSTHVTRRDLEKFQSEVLGVQNHASWYDEDNGTPRTFNPNDPSLEELNRAFDNADISMNAATMSSNVPNSGIFAGSTGYGDSNAVPNIPPRQTPSPALSHASSTTQIGGGGMGGMGGMPMNAGHQMDLHHLYEMVVELSDVLKNNRDVTKNIVANAEEIMKNGIADSSRSGDQNGENLTARIAELERALAKEKSISANHKHHREENYKMILEFQTAVGVMVEQIRNYCQNNNMHYLAQKRHYNNLLQAERDAHLESRLDRDHWHAQTMKCAEMIRTAYRLRCEEDDLPTKIISGLQNEVRAYRFALGMEAEAKEEEYGWEYLKDIPGLE